MALPPLGNYGIGLLKDTSIASIIAAPDLMLRAKDLASSSFMPMQLYVLAALLYFAMSYPLSLLVGRLERRLAAHADLVATPRQPRPKRERGRCAGRCWGRGSPWRWASARLPPAAPPSRQDDRARQAHGRVQRRHADDQLEGRQADRHRRRADRADRPEPGPGAEAGADGVVGADPGDQAGQGRRDAGLHGLDQGALGGDAAQRPDLLFRHLPAAEEGHQLLDLRGHEGQAGRHRHRLHPGARAEVGARGSAG